MRDMRLHRVESMTSHKEEEVDGFVLISRDSDQTDPPQYLDEINNAVDDVADAFWPVNKRIHDNPELGYREFIAHHALTTFMEGLGDWKVTRSAYGMKTAWVAVFDSGRPGPVVSFNAEMGETPRNRVRVELKC